MSSLKNKTEVAACGGGGGGGGRANVKFWASIFHSDAASATTPIRSRTNLPHNKSIDVNSAQKKADLIFGDQAESSPAEWPPETTSFRRPLTFDLERGIEKANAPVICFLKKPAFLATRPRESFPPSRVRASLPPDRRVRTIWPWLI